MRIFGRPVLRLPCVNKGGARSVVRLDCPAVVEKEMALPPDAVRALSYWSIRPGAIVTVVDSQGICFRARLVDSNKVVPFQPLVSTCVPSKSLTLYQALPEKERFELILQKSVELGVQRIVPFVCSHSTTLAERDAGQRKSHRWPEVVLRAAKQCRRGDIPELGPVMSFDQVLEEVSMWDLNLMLYEGDAQARLHDAFTSKDISSASIIIGPEGGFARHEAQQASDAGILTVSLGPRILRTETAAIAGAALVQFMLGGLD
ncbi:RNA methyltransferase, RsmE family [Syntrophotalea carbinolica DSM 2380]|uniref:16S rRNA (uracil(1498)-N(3))-methyltransferase n=1 Tax=Syntrophotalea carbinolica (strain DSM 2380 / NBRC 103641 / GraBd1) TaxID=338963 RepID=Q3A4B3_SYNC1|nr:RNA methyltransferase, RsmE family [Syntrophotalea carbinolica DSM 2380]